MEGDINGLTCCWLLGIMFEGICKIYFRSNPSCIKVCNWALIEELESIIVAILFGVFISLVAQVGDFFESYIKRQHSIKNSSNLIPGHGGMLDRLDSTLFAFIFIYLGNIWVN